MITFSILVMMLLLLGVFIVLAISIGGAGAIILFGDVIVCMAIIVWVIKRLFKKKKK